jgi:drug/metabolite transporter (DMT)-like permease
VAVRPSPSASKCSKDACLTATPAIYAKLIGAMFMWGGTWIAGRIVAQELPAPLFAAALRFVLAGLALAAFALATEGGVKTFPRLSDSREWGAVTGLAATGIFLYGLCFFYGLKAIPAGRGALVVALNPVVVALIAWLAGQERMTPRKFAGIAVALAGCLVVIGNGDPFALFAGAVGGGEALIVGCVLCWAAYTFIGRSATTTLSPLTATLYASLIGALLLGAAAVVEGGLSFSGWSWRVWASVVFLAIGGTALGYTWFTDGVRVIGAARASVFINLVPVFAVLQAALLLDERLAPAVLAGGVLVIAGVVATTYQQESSR